VRTRIRPQCGVTQWAAQMVWSIVSSAVMTVGNSLGQPARGSRASETIIAQATTPSRPKLAFLESKIVGRQLSYQLARSLLHTGTRRRARRGVADALKPGREGEAASDAGETVARLRAGGRDRPGRRRQNTALGWRLIHTTPLVQRLPGIIRRVIGHCERHSTS
jgi:hypothetical protein